MYLSIIFFIISLSSPIKVLAFGAGVGEVLGLGVLLLRGVGLVGVSVSGLVTGLVGVGAVCGSSNNKDFNLIIYYKYVILLQVAIHLQVLVFLRNC